MLISISTALSSACLTIRRISGQSRIGKCVVSKASCALHGAGPGWEAWCSLVLSRRTTRQLYGGASFHRRRTLISMALDVAQPSCTGKTRQYPDEPRVGIGVVMLRTGPAKHDGTQAAEVLLVRRAKAPEIGKWTVPGGSLELGETMVGCAIREALEETGMHLRNDAEAGIAAEQAVVGLSETLETPTPFAAADVITHDDSGRLSFHYAIVEVAALLQDPYADLKPGGDVDAAQWKEVSSLPAMKDLTKNSAKICMEAAKRFAKALHKPGRSH